jgi:hypothetical protein
MVDVGDGADGLLYEFSPGDSVTTITSPALEDGYEYAFLIDNLEMSSSGDGTIAFQTSTGGGYTQVSSVSFTTPNGQTALFGVYEFRLPRLVSNLTTPRQEIGGLTLTSAKITNCRIETTSSISSGKVYWLRRREYVTG